MVKDTIKYCASVFDVPEDFVLAYLNDEPIPEEYYKYFEQLPGVIECIESDPTTDIPLPIATTITMDFRMNIRKTDKRTDFWEINEYIVDSRLRAVYRAKKYLYIKYGITEKKIIEEWRKYEEKHIIKRFKEFVLNLFGRADVTITRVTYNVLQGRLRKKKRKKRSPIPKNIIRRRIVEDYLKGVSVNEIARKYRVGFGTIYRILREAGVYKRKRPVRRHNTMITDDVVRVFCAVYKATGLAYIASAVAGVSTGSGTRIKKLCDKMTPPNYREVAAREMARCGVSREKTLELVGVPPPDNVEIDPERRMKYVLIQRSVYDHLDNVSYLKKIGLEPARELIELLEKSY